MRIPFEKMQSEFKRILLSLDFNEEKAAQCAAIFAENSRDGVYTHGLNRFPTLVEFVKDRDSKEPDAEATLEIIKDAVAHGLLMIRAGLFSNCIRLLPPIVITDEQLAEGLQVLEDAIARAQEKRMVKANY